MTFKVRSVMGCAAMMAGLLATGDLRGFECLDDFEDGSIKDGDPCTWVTEAPNCGHPSMPYSVEGGELILGDNSTDFVATWLEEILSGDVSVRLKARSTGGNTVAAFIHHVDIKHNCHDGYWGYVNIPSGKIAIGCSKNNGQVVTELAAGWLDWPLPIEDWFILQFDYIGGMLQLRVWRPEDEMPEPLQVADSTFESGQAGTYAYGSAAYDYIWVLGPPEAAMTVAPESGPALLPVTVDGSASGVSPSRSLVSYRWDFGDGTTAEGVNATHTYTEAGTYTVRLTVTDDWGLSGSATRKVYVDTPPPVCPTCFECLDDFEDGSIKDGDPCTWVTEAPNCGHPSMPFVVEGGELILGDNSTDFVATWLEEILSGDVSVRLQAKSTGGNTVAAFIHHPDMKQNCSDGYWGYVNIPSGKIAIGCSKGSPQVVTELAASWLSPPPSVGDWFVLQFDYVGGMLQLRVWRPEDEMPEPLQVADSTFESGQVGTYSWGSAAYDYIWVLGPPTAAMTVDPEIGPAPLTVTVDGSLSCTCPGRNPLTYLWDFGDGTTAEGVKATHTYAEAGAYTVRLTVTDSEGISGAATREIRVGCSPGSTGTWSFSDIGQPSIPGSAGFESGDESKDLHVCTSGKRIGSTSDECSMLYKEIAGDFRITARIASVDHVGSGGGVGVMVRESLDEGAIAEAMLVYWPLPTSSRRARCGYRLIRGESMSSKVESIGSGEAPVWVRLERRADTLSAFYSLDGESWPPCGEPAEFTSLPETLLAGVAACKGTATVASGPQALQAVITSLEVGPLDPVPLFRRADANADGTADISDAITILGFLFLGGTMNDCRDAADVNDDGNVDISDPVGLLGHLFQGGPAPPAPFPGCGGDSSPDNPREPINGDLGCNTYDRCP